MNITILFLLTITSDACFNPDKSKNIFQHSHVLNLSFIKPFSLKLTR